MLDVKCYAGEKALEGECTRTELQSWTAGCVMLSRNRGVLMAVPTIFG